MTALRLYRLLVYLAGPILRLSLSRRARKGREDRTRLRENGACLTQAPRCTAYLDACSQRRRDNFRITTDRRHSRKPSCAKHIADHRHGDIGCHGRQISGPT